MEPKMADPVELAVVWVEKARKGSTQWLSACDQQQMLIYGIRKRVKPLVHCAMFVYLALAFFEEPSWCLGSEITCAAEIEDMLSFGIPELPFQLSNAIELLCLATFAVRTWLRWKSLGRANQNSRWHTFGLVAQMVAVLDIVVAFFNVTGIIWWNNFKLARLCRPFVFLACYKRLRETAGQIARSIPDFFAVLASLGLCVVLFAFAGMVLFADTEEGASFFGSWRQAIGSMWILFTTANNPDVWIKTYNENRCSFFFFSSYLVLTLYLLNNILLAAVNGAYRTQLKTHIGQFTRNRALALENAFELLSGSKTAAINKAQWDKFFQYFCDPGLGGVGLDVTGETRQKLGDQLFIALDTDRNGCMNLDEFKQVVSYLQDTQDSLHQTVVKRPQLIPLRRLMTAGWDVRGWRVHWDQLVDVAIAGIVFYIFVCTLVFQESRQGTGGGRGFILATTVFSCLYLVETLLKVCILGWRSFWDSPRSPAQNRVDLLTVAALFSLEMFVLFFRVEWQASLVKVILLLHLSRVIRLLHHVSPLEKLGSQIIVLAPTFWLLFLLLIIVFYIYVTIGEQVFGGLVRKEGATGAMLADTPFGQADYYALNFNDFASGVVAMFCLMVINNWIIFSNAYALVTGSDWAHAFFVSFFLVVNLIVLNILMALILECFTKYNDVIDHASGEEADANDKEGTEEPLVRRGSRVRDPNDLLRRMVMETLDD